jgi:hypothetical protein
VPNPASVPTTSVATAAGVTRSVSRTAPTTGVAWRHSGVATAPATPTGTAAAIDAWSAPASGDLWRASPRPPLASSLRGNHRTRGKTDGGDEHRDSRDSHGKPSLDVGMTNGVTNRHSTPKTARLNT